MVWFLIVSTNHMDKLFSLLQQSSAQNDNKIGTISNLLFLHLWA